MDGLMPAVCARFSNRLSHLCKPAVDATGVASRGLFNAADGAVGALGVAIIDVCNTSGRGVGRKDDEGSPWAKALMAQTLRVAVVAVRIVFLMIYP